MYIQGLCSHYNVNPMTKLKDLPATFMDKLLYGTGDEKVKFVYHSKMMDKEFEEPFEGVINTLQRRANETKSQGMRDFYEYYMSNSDCTECNGTRLKKESLSVKVGDKNIHELTNMSINKIKEHINSLKLKRQEEIISDQIIKELNITENTLKYHNKNIYSKLGVYSRKNLVEIVLELKKQNKM